MTKQKFQIIQLIIVVLLIVAFCFSLITEISYITPLAIIISAAIINYLYHQVNEITADERDYKIAGLAAQATLNIFSITLTFLGIGLLIYSLNNPYYYRLGYLLLYVVCFLLVLNIFSFLYYQKRGDK